MARRRLDGTDVVLMGAFDYSYPREKSLKEGFEGAGAVVHQCRYGEETTFPGPRKALLLPVLYWRIAREMATIRNQTKDIDLLVVTKFNPLLLPLAAFYAWRLDIPLVYDLFVSLHRTADMRDMAWPVVKATYLIERLTYALPDHILVCTDQFANLYATMHRLPRDRFVILPPGADEDRFQPRDATKREGFTSLYWGNFLPHHGVDVIIEAAELLARSDDVEFVFLGTGPREEAARRLADDKELPNVTFEGFVPGEELQRWIAESHVCLGVFSDDPRAVASVTNKVCEAVASGKATVTEESPATSAVFLHGEDIFLVPPDDPEALAEAIRDLRDDPGLLERLEKGAYEVHLREFSVDRLAERLATAFGEETSPPS